MGKTVKEIDASEVVSDYLSNIISVDALSKKYHVGKLRIKQILSDNGVVIRKRGGQQKNLKYKIEDWSNDKYSKIEGKHYIAVSKDKNYSTNDYMNKAGKLTSYIESLGIDVPSLYERRKYYMIHGDYWWEQWFDIVLLDDKPTKKCPYCNWKTHDIENLSGAFEQHILKEHNVNVSEYLQNHKEDEKYFKSFVAKKQRLKNIIPQKKHVVCPICGKLFSKINETHLKTHGLTMNMFRKKYFDHPILSERDQEQCHKDLISGILVVAMLRLVSMPEIEFLDFLIDNILVFQSNSHILEGHEIDLLIPSMKIGIEFDGLLWHSEFFGGKKHKYHLDKTINANRKGYGLVHIFEDEFTLHKDIVFSKLRHLLNLDANLPKVQGRKCTIKEIIKKDSEEFLSKYHIQGFASATIYVGCFFHDELVGVMSFKNGSVKNDGWELNRFATKPCYQYQGIGSKLFSYFVKNYNPNVVYSFADRRWTLDANNNLYTKLGFDLERITPPDYSYFSRHAHIPTRIHKMTFSKNKLIRKYNLPHDLTEREMAIKLGYDRIWNCGLFKYVFYNKGL